MTDTPPEQPLTEADLQDQTPMLRSLTGEGGTLEVCATCGTEVDPAFHACPFAKHRVPGETPWPATEIAP